MSKLPISFYQRPDVVQISRELLGKCLFTRINGITSAGLITETEAYAGAVDKACHAYGNRRTKRTETMFAPGGVAYIYLCYGIHHLFNIVTNEKDIPHAVLVRAIYPQEGIEHILQRRNKTTLAKGICGGPGTASQGLGLKTSMDGTDLQGNVIWVEDKGIAVPDTDIQVGPRIGVDYAGEDAKLPYRFWLEPGYFG